jgi:hypothetical protein
MGIIYVVLIFVETGASIVFFGGRKNPEKNHEENWSLYI